MWLFIWDITMLGCYEPGGHKWLDRSYGIQDVEVRKELRYLQQIHLADEEMIQLEKDRAGTMIWVFYFPVWCSFLNMVSDVAWYVSSDSPRSWCQDRIKCVRISLGETPLRENWEGAWESWHTMMQVRFQVKERGREGWVKMLQSGVQPQEGLARLLMSLWQSSPRNMLALMSLTGNSPWGAWP